MAKSLELDIVVEGVETVAELEFFREQAVHIIQGYIFSAPVPAEPFQKLLAPRHFARALARLRPAAGQQRQRSNDSSLGCSRCSGRQRPAGAHELGIQRQV